LAKSKALSGLLKKREKQSLKNSKSNVNIEFIE